MIAMNMNTIGSIFGIYTYISHTNQLNVGKYVVNTIHGSNWGMI